MDLWPAGSLPSGACGNRNVIATHEKHLARRRPSLDPSPELVVTTSCANY